MIRDFQLAGGSGLAAHLGHRRSLDLDLFSSRGEIDLDRLQRGLRRALRDIEIVDRSDASLRCRLGPVPIDFVSYPYESIGPSSVVEGVALASVEDIAAMKLAAVARRGIRRDFWNLHAILAKHMSLADALAAYRKKFGKTEPDTYHVLKALTYFQDADDEALWPAGLTARKWETIKAFFRKAAPQVLLGR